MYREKLLNRYACSSNSIDHCAGRELIKQVFFQVPTKMPSGYATVCPTLSCFYSSFSRLEFPLFRLAPGLSSTVLPATLISLWLKIDPVTAIGDILKS